MNVAEISAYLELGLVYGLVATGIYLTFRIIDFTDLTCDGSFALGTAISGAMLQGGHPPAVALLFSVIGGGVAGLFTGIFSTVLGMTDLLSGILTAFALYSVNIHVMGGLPNIAVISSQSIFGGHNSLLGLFLLLTAVLGAVGYLLNTDFGLGLRSIGQNKVLARNYGIRVGLMTVSGLVLGNCLIAMGGALFSQLQGFADVNSGIGSVIVGLASIAIGERVLVARSLWLRLFSCVLGSIIYRLIIGAALHADFLGIETHDLNLVTGAIVLAVMMLRKKCCN